MVCLGLVPTLAWLRCDWLKYSQIKRVEIRSCQHQYKRKQKVKNTAQNSNHAANVLRSYNMHLLNGNDQTKKWGAFGGSFSVNSLADSKQDSKPVLLRSQGLKPDCCVPDYPSPCVATLMYTMCQNVKWTYSITADSGCVVLKWPELDSYLYLSV